MDQAEMLGIEPQYAPWHLTGLRQPRPRDLPSYLDDSFFTFDDAFRDLLALHYGAEMVDIRVSYAQRLGLTLMWPRGEPVEAQKRRYSSMVKEWKARRLEAGMEVFERVGLERGEPHIHAEQPWAMMMKELNASRPGPVSSREPPVTGQAPLPPDAWSTTSTTTSQTQETTHAVVRIRGPDDETELAEHIKACEHLKDVQPSWPSAYEALRTLLIEEFSMAVPPYDASYPSSWDDQRLTVSRAAGGGPLRAESSWRGTDSGGNRLEVVQDHVAFPDGRRLSRRSEHVVDAFGNTTHRKDESLQESGWTWTSQSPEEREERENAQRNRPKYLSWLWAGG